MESQQEELQHSNAELEEKAALLAAQNRDIEVKNTEIEEARQELEERAQQLAGLDSYKSEFLANMSHELRTPLNCLLILAKLLADNAARNLTPKQVEFAEIIHWAGSDLLQLINDILDLSKVEAGKMDVSPERVSLLQLIDYVEATFRPLTAEKGLDFSVTRPPELRPTCTPTTAAAAGAAQPAVQRGEVHRAGRCGAVIEPASDDEQCRAGCCATGHGDGVPVNDTGIGIAASKLRAIFGAFKQADGTTSRKYGGTGLGLSISREIAHLLGGEVTVDSTPGRGSTFTLYLPVARRDFKEVIDGGRPVERVLGESPAAIPVGAPGVPVALGPPGRRPRRLLVVEERPRGLLTLVAESVVADMARGRDDGTSAAPVDIVTAVGAHEAAGALAAEPCHCVVLELGMPDAEASRFLEALHDDSALTGVPVLVHSGHRADLAQERSLQSRAAGKPMEFLSSLDELRERITLHLSAEQPGDVLALVRPDDPQPEGPPPVDDAVVGRTVLVVDDDARNLFALSGILELHGVRVLHAENGREGIDTLRNNPEIALVLMDVMMPEMDGYTATAEIRRMPEYAELPIVAVTAKAMPGDREKSLASGASDYVTKPVDTHDLMACVRRWLTV